MPIRRELGKRTGAFSQGILLEGKRIIFVAGKVAMDDAGNLVGRGDVAAQARQVFRNVESTLAEAGATLRDLVKITCFLVPMERYAEYSAVRAEVFGAGPYPTSATVGVTALASPDYLIEIEAIAAID